jgi:hypothetical protein
MGYQMFHKAVVDEAAKQRMKVVEHIDNMFKVRIYFEYGHL